MQKETLHPYTVEVDHISSCSTMHLLSSENSKGSNGEGKTSILLFHVLLTVVEAIQTEIQWNAIPPFKDLE